VFVVFGLVSVAFWAYFTFRRPPGTETEVATEGFATQPPDED
jgi:hypothetical protein